MHLDRWIALVFVLVCLLYGYAAFFTMDDLLPPFMLRNPVWPSTFPKVLSLAGVICGMLVLLGMEKPAPGPAKVPDIDYRRLTEYKLGQALMLLGLMVAYALTLRALGFLLSTFAFLTLGAALLGERRFTVLLPVAALATGSVWYLVQEVLGIFLSPLPRFL
jgi:putative tricarboxylic transport membrane protein